MLKFSSWKKKNWLKLGFVVQRVIWGKLPHRISKSKMKKIFKSVYKEEIGLLWSSESFEVKYNIRFGIHIEFPKQNKKKYSNRSINKEIGLLWSRQSFGESTISNLESQSKFQVKEEKNYSNRSRNNEIML